MQTNILEYLDYTAEKFADKIAFEDEKGAITYAALKEEAQALGTLIAKKYGCVNRPVAVLTDRRYSPIVGYMAALYSGNFYVPVDVKMPADRMARIFKTTEPLCLILREDQERFASEADIDKLYFGSADIPADEKLLTEVRRSVLDIDPCYLLFTSGSTGEPKGIAVSHRSLIDFTEWFSETFESSDKDVLGNQAPFFFDASNRDLYPCLKCGSTMHILPRKFFSFPVLLCDYINEKGINVLNWATAAFHMIANSGILAERPVQGIRLITLGGEALQAKQLNVWKDILPDTEYVNVYGPAETTTDCCYYIIDRDFEDGESIPIGKACRNMQLIVAEDGELLVRGSGVALGYYNDAERTDAAFIQNPYNDKWPEKLYRTGDIVKMLPDGNLLFLERKDNQIKHVGHRVELGEVETVINGLAEIDHAACLFDAEKDKIICVYQGSADEKQLASLLRQKLSDYMQPNVYVRKDEMPFNSSSKIDRAALKKEILS